MSAELIFDYRHKAILQIAAHQLYLTVCTYEHLPKRMCCAELNIVKDTFLSDVFYIKVYRSVPINIT